MVDFAGSEVVSGTVLSVTVVVGSVGDAVVSKAVVSSKAVVVSSKVVVENSIGGIVLESDPEISSVIKSVVISEVVVDAGSVGARVCIVVDLITLGVVNSPEPDPEASSVTTGESTLNVVVVAG